MAVPEETRGTQATLKDPVGIQHMDWQPQHRHPCSSSHGGPRDPFQLPLGEGPQLRVVWVLGAFQATLLFQLPQHTDSTFHRDFDYREQHSKPMLGPCPPILRGMGRLRGWMP